MGCDCGKPKCDGHCGVSPAVLQINNPSECVLFHRVEVPASMGDSKTNPPKSGAYKNVLLYYEADQTSWLYSSDGVPQKLVNGGADSPIRLTVAYGEGAWTDGDMPGLNIDYSSATGGSFIGGRIIPSPTFTDESTGTVYTSEDVYGLLEDGKKIILDAVPLGWRINDSSEPVVQLVDGVPIVSKVNYGGGAGAYFGGTMCPYVLSETVTMFGVSVLRQINPDQSVAYSFVTQGVESFTTPI